MKNNDYETFALNSKVKVIYPVGYALCKKHETTPVQMKNLFLAYNKDFIDVIKFFCLDDVIINFRIDNLKGGGIDSAFDMKLTWKDVPQGIVSIFLGSYSDDHTDTPQRTKQVLSHELVHVLIFAYLSKFLNFPTTWTGWGHKLPKNCEIPRLYIELLCDTLGLMTQLENLDSFVKIWREEWDPKNYEIHGDYYFSNNRQYALDFIQSQTQYISHQLKQVSQDNPLESVWKSILDYYFKSEESKEWINDVKTVFKSKR